MTGEWTYNCFCTPQDRTEFINSFYSEWDKPEWDKYNKTND